MRPSISNINNINSNVNTSHPQILCLSHPQQQQFLSTSLNSQQLAQLGSFPIVMGTSGASTSRIVQLESLTNDPYNFTMFASPSSIIHNQQEKLLLIDADIKNSKYFCFLI